MLKILFKYADPKFVRINLALLTLEQGVNALVTALLALAGQNLFNKNYFLTLIVSYLLIAQLPTLIQVTVRYFETRGYFTMYFHFLDERLVRRAGQPAVWANVKQRDRYLTAIGPEAQSDLTSLAFTCFDSFSFALNILFNTVTFSLLISADYLWVFSLSMLLGFLVYRAQRKSVHAAVEREQTSRLEFGAHLLRAWDNLFLRNWTVRDRYVKRLRNVYHDTLEKTGVSAYRANASVFWIGLVSVLPVLGLNFYLVNRDHHDVARLASMLITLPRQLQVLGMFRALFVQMTNLKMFAVRFQTSLSNSRLDPIDLGAQIDFGRVSIGSTNFSGLGEIVRFFRSQDSGRFTVRGPNGAGKSSLLLQLHTDLADSFYLPATSRLEMGPEVEGPSTGQRVLAHLRCLMASPPPVLLLDEWDANLDLQNRELLSNELDRLARTVLVIEVRHYGGGGTLLAKNAAEGVAGTFGDG